MRKTLGFWLVLVMVVAAVVASVPLSQQQTLTSITPKNPVIDANAPNPDELVIPVDFMGEGAFEGRPGHDPLDVTDSTMFIDSLEGAFADWTSADLAAGIFWHPDTARALGAAGTSWWCASIEIPGYNNHWFQSLVLPVVDLSGAPAPSLSFKCRWSCEDPTGAEAPYNMWDGWNIWGSTDGGTTWAVLQPSTPNDPNWGDPAGTNYSQTSSYAFGEEWALGSDIPAYGGQSPEFRDNWTTCTVPLTTTINRLRITFCSDPAFCSLDDETYFGLHIDSLRLVDGGAVSTTLYSNDGAADGQITLAAGPESPDTWVFESDSTYGEIPGYHSANSAWNAQQTAFNVVRAIYSYPITLPAGYQKLQLRYWVWCDLPDQDGDADDALDDYYAIYVSTNNGVIWTQAVYDYGYDNGSGNSLTGWTLRSGGLQSGGIPVPQIELVAGDGSSPVTVRIAFEAKLDANDDGGSGTGLHIDDVELVAIRAQNIDAATRDMVVPQPVTVGLNRSWTFVYANEGLNNLSQLRYRVRYWRPDSTAIPPSADSTIQVLPGVLLYGETTTGTKYFTPNLAGPWLLRVYSAITGEEDRSNDTTYSPGWPGVNVPNVDDSTVSVWARPAGTYELGYGRRAVANAYLQPRYMHFTPAIDGVPAADADTIDMTQLRIMWRYDAELGSTGGRVQIDFWEEGADSFHTGPLINSIVEFIDTSETIGAGGFIHWWEKDLTGIPGLSNRTGNFWVSITQLDSFVINGELTPAPLPLGISPGVPGDGHTYFKDVNGVLNQSGGRLLFNVLIQPTQTSTPDAVDDLVIRREGITNDVNLIWGAAPRANGYFVWRLTTPNQAYQTGELLTTLPIMTTSYVDVNALNEGIKFFYVVVATN